MQVWGDVVIAGAADASLVLLSNMQGTWTITQKVTTGTCVITHLDSDGDTLAVGTHTGVQLWKVENKMNTEGDLWRRKRLVHQPNFEGEVRKDNLCLICSIQFWCGRRLLIKT